MGREWKRYHYPGQKDVHDDDGNVRFHKVGFVFTEMINYSRTPVTRTLRGNEKQFELAGVRDIGVD